MRWRGRGRGQGDRVWQGRIDLQAHHTRPRQPTSAQKFNQGRDEATHRHTHKHTHTHTQGIPHSRKIRFPPLQPSPHLSTLQHTPSIMAARTPGTAGTALRQSLHVAAAGPSRIAATPRVTAYTPPQSSSAPSLCHRSFSTATASRNVSPAGPSAASTLPDQGSDKLRKTLADLIADSIKVSCSARSLCCKAPI